MDFKKTTENLKKKMEYLLRVDSREEFEILDFDLEFFNQQSLLEEYEILLTFDYLLLWDSLPRGFGKKLEEVTSKISNYASKYRITDEYKLIKSDGIYTGEPFITSMNYVFEEKHIVSISLFFIAEPT
jgi:hypothetical protein